jgi:hypothetical protein
MDRHCGKLINVIATGFIVLVLFSLVLFWGRFLCYANLISAMPLGPKGIIIWPSRLVPGELASERRKLPDQPYMGVLPPGEPNHFYALEPGPNEPSVQVSRFSAEIEPAFVFIKAIGAFWDMKALARMRDINERTYFWFKDENNYLGWDNRSGLLVRRYESKVEGPAGELVTKSSELFAGPNGVSKTADSSLGRFHNQLIVFDKYSEADRFVIYDAKYRRFYLGDFMKGNVIKGLQLEESDSREPVRIGTICVSGFYNTGGMWSSPRVRNAANSAWVDKELFLPGDFQSEKGRICTTEDRTCTYIPVLDKTGRISIYNAKEQTLTLAGYLPKPESLFATDVHNEIARPKDVLAYKVLPVYATLRVPDDPNNLPDKVDVKYLGVNVTCISREGTVLTAAVFDPNGALVYCCDTKYGNESTAGAIYSDSPGAPLATTILFLLENLQPPVFEVASYLSGDIIDASAGHRAIFVLPNSFVGMLGRYKGIHFDREVFLPILMGPSLILSLWLAVKVRKDAKLIGLSSTAGKWWIIGVIIFGLPAYITYRMNRHREVLVTCQNCGMMRRPDMEKCHRCGSKWEMPELTPPSWRICD